MMVGRTLLVFSQDPPFPQSINVPYSEGFVAYQEKYVSSSLFKAGDFNGDGIDDFFYDNSSGTYLGCIFFGSKMDWKDTVSLPDLYYEKGFQIISLDEGYARVEAIGDINGDGYDDLMGTLENISLPDCKSELFVIFGNDEENLPNPFYVDRDLDTYGAIIQKGFSTELFSNFNNLGDFNGDGIEDFSFEARLYVGAEQCENIPEFYQKKLYVIYGSKDFKNVNLNMGNLEASQGFVITNRNSNNGDELVSANGVGDVNGDGKGDIVLTASMNFSDSLDDDAFVLFGSSNYGGLEIDLGDIDSLMGLKLGYERDNNHYYTFFVSGLGDVNGDGFDDLAIYAAYDNWIRSNKLYIYFGRKSVGNFSLNLSSDEFEYGSILKLDPSVVLIPASGKFDINNDGLNDIHTGKYVIYGHPLGFPPLLTDAEINGYNGFVINNSSGYTSNFGDINGDGIDDITVYSSEPDRNPSFIWYFIFGKESDFIKVSKQDIESELIRLFPNPVQDHLKISFDKKLQGSLFVKISSIDGKEIEVFESDYKALSKELSFNVSGFSDGIYLVNVLHPSSGRVWVSKFLKY